jgi:hypothetical protein
MKDFDEYPDVAGALPEALASASPHRLPAELRARVLRAAELRAGRSRARFGMPTVPRTLGAAAAVLLIVGLAVWNLQLQQALAQEQTLLQQFRDKAGQQPIVFDIVDSSTSQKVNLAATGPQRPGERPAYGKLYANPGFTQIVLMAGRLPDPPPQREYRVHVVMGDGSERTLGVLPVDASGFGYLVYDTGTLGPSFSAARVYLQPSGTTTREGVLTLRWENR